jgi:hypothetical protein
VPWIFSSKSPINDPERVDEKVRATVTDRGSRGEKVGMMMEKTRHLAPLEKVSRVPRLYAPG